MKGTVDQCTITPENRNYQYMDVIDKLESQYGFKEIGEGGFGVILAGNNCAIKIIKDIRRCTELDKEKAIYNIIESNRPLPGTAKIPAFGLYAELDTFCHFNIERIHSPLSGWGSMDEDDYGNGYVLKRQNNTYTFRDLQGEIYEIPKNKVYGIDRPGSLIHFYVNHFDPDMKEKLDQNQGILMGLNVLTFYFTKEHVIEYTFEIGKLLSFLMFVCYIIPTDIEIVLASKSSTEHEIVPFIYDFNESTIYNQTLSPEILCPILARSMYAKNGKYYFPNKSNPYYKAFYMGFVEESANPELASIVLDLYDSLF